MSDISMLPTGLVPGTTKVRAQHQTDQNTGITNVNKDISAFVNMTFAAGVITSVLATSTPLADIRAQTQPACVVSGLTLAYGGSGLNFTVAGGTAIIAGAKIVLTNTATIPITNGVSQFLYLVVSRTLGVISGANFILQNTALAAPADSVLVGYLVSLAGNITVFKDYRTRNYVQRTATVTIAAFDSQPEARVAADFVCTGTADQTTINLALGLLSKWSGTPSSATDRGKVIFMAGSYAITGAINLLNNIDVHGEGSGVVLKIPNATNGTFAVFTGTSISNIVLRSLTVDGNRANQTSGATSLISLTTCTNVEIRSCFFNNAFTNGVLLSGSSLVVFDTCSLANNAVGVLMGTSNDVTIAGSMIGTSVSHNVSILGTAPVCVNPTIRNTILRSAGGNGIVVISADNFNANDCTVNGNALNGILLSGCTNGQVSGNTVYSNTQRGIQLDTSSTFCVVNSNIVRNNTQDGIYLGAGLNCIVDSNTVRASGINGIRIQNSTFTTVHGNRVDSSQQHGIFSDTCTDADITGNFVTNSGIATANTYSGVQLTTSTTNNVQGNICRQGTSDPRFGVGILNGTNNMAINNDLVTSVNIAGGGGRAQFSTAGAGASVSTYATAGNGNRIV